MSFPDPAALGPTLGSLWVQGPLVFVFWVAGFLFAHRVLMRWLRRIAARTAWTWDDVIVEALSIPAPLAIVASGLLVMERILPLDQGMDRACDVMLAASIVLALILFVDSAVRGLLERMSGTSSALQGARGLIQGSVRGIIIAIGLLIFLDSIGIPITPILASLGVGSLAVALALQETLANLFAGFHLIADKPIEAGQLVRLQTGEEGNVDHVGWRSTWITTPQNNTVVVPNAKLAGSVLINFDLPSSRTTFGVDVPIATGSDLARVEAVTLEVARETLGSVPGASRGFEPVVRFLGFGETGLKLTAVLSAVSQKDSPLVRHEFLKRLTERYRREGIAVSYPTRTIVQERS